MAKKLTKKQVAELIVSEFPDRGDSVNKLAEDHTLVELEALLDELRADDSERDDAGDAETSSDSAADADEASKDPEAKKDAEEAPGDGPKLYKLADPSKQYHGVEFSIKGDEEKPLPKKRDAELMRRIKAGYLIEVGD